MKDGLRDLTRMCEWIVSFDPPTDLSYVLMIPTSSDD